MGRTVLDTRKLWKIPLVVWDVPEVRRSRPHQIEIQDWDRTCTHRTPSQHLLMANLLSCIQSKLLHKVQFSESNIHMLFWYSKDAVSEAIGGSLTSRCRLQGTGIEPITFLTQSPSYILKWSCFLLRLLTHSARDWPLLQHANSFPHKN